MDNLADKGMIDKHLFKSQEKRPKENQSTPNGGEKIDTEVIHVIVGGFAVGGPTMQGNKKYHRSLSQVMVSDRLLMIPSQR